MRSRSFYTILCAICLSTANSSAFDLQISVDPSAAFSPGQLAKLQSSINYSETLWEHVVTGYQPGISLTGISISVTSGNGFAEATYPATVVEAGYTLSTFSIIFVNPTVIDNYASWTGVGVANPKPEYLGHNYLNDIIAHEVGHVLGIGQLWEDNGVYALGSGEYTGVYGVVAFRHEFNPLATFVPVEQALSSAADQHWDQIMRSSPDEGNPSDPFSLSPLTGITDVRGRDLGLELMTGAVDADYGRPFLSQTTIQSLRDLGFTVVPEPSSAILVLVAYMLLPAGRRRISCWEIPSVFAPDVTRPGNGDKMLGR